MKNLSFMTIRGLFLPVVLLISVAISIFQVMADCSDFWLSSASRMRYKLFLWLDKNFPVVRK